MSNKCDFVCRREWVNLTCAVSQGSDDDILFISFRSRIVVYIRWVPFDKFHNTNHAFSKFLCFVLVQFP
jgi:hypothetical protein